MHSPKKLLLVFGISSVVFIVISAICIIFTVSVVSTIEILDENGHRLGLLPIEEKVFIHHYIHSINRTAVDEEFRISGSNLELYRLRFDTYGVGMPSDGGESFRIEDNRFVVDMTRTFKRLDIRVSHVPGHGLILGGVFHPFTKWVPIESLVILKAGTKVLFSPRRKAHL